MCLIVNKTASEALKSLSLIGTITGYKVFSLSYNYSYSDGSPRAEDVRVTGRFQTNYTYTPGVHEAECLENYRGEIHEGIHFCLKESEAKSLSSSNVNIVKDIELDLADLVAVGSFSDWNLVCEPHKKDKQAVFRKFTLTTEKYNEMLNDLVNLHKKRYPDFFANGYDLYKKCA